MKVQKSELLLSPFKVNALSLIPENFHESSSVAIFTHGYTTHKGDVLPWAARFAEANIPSIIFDLPGHYLGSFEEVTDFNAFKEKAHEIFSTAFFQLINQINNLGYNFTPKKILLAGHSLGALLAIKALPHESFKNYERIAVGVGIGINQSKSTHLFETSFYQRTLVLRRQLVSPALDSDLVFPWIKEDKTNLSIPNERIHLITGLDDVVVGTNGTQAFYDVLTKNGAQITMEEPAKLAHHEPGLAAAHLYSFYKKNYL